MAAPSPNYLERVRESCIAFKTPEAHVDRAAAEKFAKSIDIQHVKTLGSNLANMHEFDVIAANTSFSHLNFPDAQAEVNLISLAHALDFGYV